MDELLLLSYREHLALLQQKHFLESRYKVKINMPEINSKDSCGNTDLTCINISGDEKNIKSVKNIFKKKKQDHQEQNASIIILSSDSDSDSDSEDSEDVCLENKNNVHKRKRAKTEKSKVDADTSVEIVQIVKKPCEKVKEKIDISFEIIPICSKPCEKIGEKLDSQHNQSVTLLESTKELTAAEDFIPLASNKNNKNPHKKTCAKKNIELDIIEISDEETDVVKIPPKPRELRPVVIDGSNIARAHGKSTNTFSCKGIKISVEYFLKRGHSKVTAFVPKYRQYCSKGPIITTNPEILEELELTENLVFTPSRRVNGKMYSCYDDRFIVQYASSNEGVVLSNDNYKDLINESPEFKETIEKRLLMFCFVGDTLMIPADPLGQKGPSLEEFLSIPPKDD